LKNSEVALPAIQLPEDYDDIGLIHWDIELNAKKQTSDTVNAYMDLSIGDDTYAFDNNPKKSYTNQTYSLDIYKSGYITGYVVNNANSADLSDVYYKLTMKYYPIMQDEDQSAKFSSILGISDVYNTKSSENSRLNQLEDQYSSILLTCNLQYTTLYNTASNLTNISNIVKSQLRDQTTISDLLKQISDSNQILMQELNNSNYYEQDLANKIKILGDKTTDYNNNQTLINSLESTLSSLRQKRTITLSKFEEYMTASEREMYNAIDRSIQNDRSWQESETGILKNAAIRNMSNLVDKIYETTLNRQPLVQTMQDETKTKLSINAKYDLDASSLEYENSLRDALIESTSTINQDFVDTLNVLQTRFDNLETELLTAESSRDMQRTRANDRLDAFNEEYDTSYATLDQANAALRKNIDKQNALAVMANQEYANLTFEEMEAKERANTATVTYLFYDALRKETQESLDYYRDTVLPHFSQQLTSLGNEKDRLSAQLTALTQNANQEKSDAQAEFDRLAIQKGLEINELKTIRSQKIQDIANQTTRRQRKIQEAIDAKNNREKIEKELQEWVQKKSRIDSEAVFYQGISDEMKADVNEYEIMKDADSIIIYSINDNINGMNYDLIVPNITNEYYNFDKYRKEIKLHASKSESEINNTFLNMKYMESRTILFLHLTLIITICMTVYYYMSSYLAVLIAVIASSIALIIYRFSTVRMVRNRAKQYYW
jgi:hypothetical protein